MSKRTLGDYRITSINRIPAGYTVYPTGIADDITNGNYGGGTKLKMDSTTTFVELQMLDHYYAIGGRAIWENAHLDCYMDAKLCAPASTGLTNVTGDFIKYNVGGPYNLIAPVSAGTGDWDIDLTATQTNTSILKCVPVPSSGNNGFFDYNSDTNVITPRLDQKGGYDLYDFNIDLFAFCRYCWGKAGNGSETLLDIPNVIGKLLFNFWKIRFDLKHDGGTLSTEKIGLVMILAAKGNV